MIENQCLPLCPRQTTVSCNNNNNNIKKPSQRPYLLPCPHLGPPREERKSGTIGICLNSLDWLVQRAIQEENVSLLPKSQFALCPQPEAVDDPEIPWAASRPGTRSQESAPALGLQIASLCCHGDKWATWLEGWMAPRWT